MASHVTRTCKLKGQGGQSTERHDRMMQAARERFVKSGFVSNLTDRWRHRRPTKPTPK